MIFYMSGVVMTWNNEQSNESDKALSPVEYKLEHLKKNCLVLGRQSSINRTEFNNWRTDYWNNRANDF